MPQTRRGVPAALLVLHTLLILLYVWSLDESDTVRITVRKSHVVAALNGNILEANLPLHATGFGIQAPPYNSYYIQGTGEAAQADTSSLFGRLAEDFRVNVADPGFDDLRAGSGVPRPVPLSSARQYPEGSWSATRRGDWTAGPGDFFLLPGGNSASYTVDVHLLRPDGAMGILFGIDSKLHGYELQVRMDRPDMQLTDWSDGTTSGFYGDTELVKMAFWPSVQRDVRLLLNAYLFALLLAALAVGAYPFAVRLLPPAEEATRLPTVPRWAAPTAVFAIGVVATALVATYLLQRMPHVQDSVAYLFEAKILAAGRFSVPAPPAPVQQFFTEEYIPMYRGQWFAQYPPGSSLMLMVGVFVHAAWLVDPILASLALVFVYLLGKRIYTLPVGLGAAGLGLLSPFWLFLGSSFMSHPAGLFFAAAFLLAFARGEMEDDARFMVLAGLAGGMLFVTRELTGVGFLAPFAVYCLGFARLPFKSYVPALAGFAPPSLLLLAYNWDLMGNPLQSTYAAENPLDHPGFGRVPWGIFTPANGFWNTSQNLEMFSVHTFGWPYGLTLSAAALPFVLGAARKWDYLLLASLLGVIAAYIFYHVSGLMYGSRYYYETMPCVLLLTARGVQELIRLPLRAWPRFGVPADKQAAAILPVLLAVVLVVFTLRFYLPTQIPLYRGYNFSSDAELQTVQRAHIHHALVFVVDNPPGAWWSYGNVFFANSVGLDGDIVYARDEGSTDSQLYTYFPGRSHYRLSGTTLTQLP